MMSFKIMWSLFLETERTSRKINLNAKNNEKNDIFPHPILAFFKVIKQIFLFY